jgi:hypothetical protein
VSGARYKNLCRERLGGNGGDPSAFENPLDKNDGAGVRIRIEGSLVACFSRSRPANRFVKSLEGNNERLRKGNEDLYPGGRLMDYQFKASTDLWTGSVDRNAETGEGRKKEREGRP